MGRLWDARAKGCGALGLVTEGDQVSTTLLSWSVIGFAAPCPSGFALLRLDAFARQ